MTIYRTELSLPLVGHAPEELFALAQAALVGDGRVVSVTATPAASAPGGFARHVDMTVRFRADTDTHAASVASELHDRALDRLLAAATTAHGWTSSYGPPELVD